MIDAKLNILVAIPNAGAHPLIEGLERHGGGRFLVESIDDLASALRRLESSDVDLLLLDAEDHGGDLAVVREAKRRAPDTCIIVLSPNPDDATMNGLLDAGAEVVVEKSEGGIGQLGDVIDRAAERRKKERAERLSEETLKEREAKLDAIFRATPVGIAVSVNRVIKDVNDTMCRMAGYTREELMGQSTRLLYDNDADFERLGAELYAALKSRGQVTMEISARHKDGHHFPMILSSSPLDPTDLSKGIVFTSMDISERKLAEEAIKEREDKLSAVLRAAPVGIAVVTGRTFREVNDTLCCMSGYSRAELIGKTTRFLYNSDADYERVGAELSRALESRQRVTIEMTGLRKDGSQLPMLLSGSPLDAADLSKGIIFTVLDITERKKAEADLQLSMSLLAATLEATADGILVVDMNSKVQRYSNRFAKMWGIPKSILKAGDDVKLIEFVVDQLADPDGFRQRIREIYAQPELSTSDTLLFKDGCIFERHSRPQRLDDKVVGRVWSFRDITDRKKMELRLVRAAEEWRATFDAIATPVSIQDRDFKIVRVNKAFAAALKTTPEALIGKTCYQVSHGTGEPVPNCPHLQTLDKGVAAEVEIHDPKSGTYTVVSTYPMFGPSGEVVASVHISQDITERKRLQERLMVTNRLASVGELAAGIAHEINNPLTGVLGFSELVLSADIPEAVRSDVQVIHSEAQRAADVVKNLLIFARRHQQIRQELSINEVITKVLALRSYEQKISNIEVVTEFDANLPPICADYFQLQQVFLNIVINAEYFMTKAHGRGKLRVKTAYRPDDKVIRIDFTDDGPGIGQADLERLFDPFFTTKEVGQGTGLGLSISHGVVQSHGGRIWAESQVGQGASFIIELPL